MGSYTRSEGYHRPQLGVDSESNWLEPIILTMDPKSPIRIGKHEQTCIYVLL